MKTKTSFPTFILLISGLVLLFGFLFWVASSDPANTRLWGDSAFLGGSLFVIAGGGALIKSAWPYIGGLARIATFILACIPALIIVAEVGTAIELDFRDYTWFAATDEPNTITEIIVTILALVAIFFATIKQKLIQGLEIQGF